MANDNGKVIEIPNAPKVEKQVVEAKPYLLTEEERKTVVAICDIAIKATGIQGAPSILSIAKIFTT